MILLDSAEHLNFFQELIHFDYWLFSKINQQWTNAFFDSVLLFLRESAIWIPFYLFLLVFITINFGRRSWWWSFSFIMTVVISDLISSHLIKLLIFRYRPCQDSLIAEQVRILVNYCPESSSFTSSHACNHFAMATFIFFTLRETSRWWWLVFFWAFIISYAQVYVGVHYPLDVAGGAVLGCAIGYGMQIFFKRQFGPLSLKQ